MLESENLGRAILLMTSRIDLTDPATIARRHRGRLNMTVLRRPCGGWKNSRMVLFTKGKGFAAVVSGRSAVTSPRVQAWTVPQELRSLTIPNAVTGTSETRRVSEDVQTSDEPRMASSARTLELDIPAIREAAAKRSRHEKPESG
jgi:hypothetical protein